MAVLVDAPNLQVELTEEGLFHVQVSEAGPHEVVDAPQRPSAEAILDQIQPLLEEHGPVFYLLGLSGIGDLSLSERWTVATRMKENRPWIRGSALYGLSTQLHFAFRVIIRVSGRKDLRVCRTREEAESWLLERKREAEEAGPPQG